MQCTVCCRAKSACLFHKLCQVRVCIQQCCFVLQQVPVIISSMRLCGAAGSLRDNLAVADNFTADLGKGARLHIRRVGPGRHQAVIVYLTDHYHA